MSHNALPTGTILDRNFQVKRVLGQGGFGITYLVQDLDLHQDMVLKEFFPADWVRRVGEQVVPLEQAEAQVSFARFLQRFLEEARLAAKVDHPNLVKVYRFFPANSTGYFAMPWQQGETLEQLLKREGKLTPQAALDLVDPLLDGLQQLHAAGLVHRDIKPANIYLRSKGGPLLIDFGAARIPATASAPLTAIFSPGFAPLEQYTADGIQGPHTDVYAVGAVLYLMLTGEKPLDALTRHTGESASRQFLPCRDAAPASVPLALREVIDQALALHVQGRIPDVPTLRSALHAAMTSAPGQAPTQAPLPTSPHSIVTPPAPKSKAGLVGTIAAAALIGVAAVAFWPREKAEPAIVDNPPPKVSSTTPVVQPPEPVSVPVPVPVPANQALVDQMRKDLPPSDLPIEVVLDPALNAERPQYLEGEQIAIGFIPKEDAYVAVFIYTEDGSVAMLYPNEYAKAQLAKGNVRTWVGSGSQKFRIQVAPPFGNDIIHVVAFRAFEDLKRLLSVLKLDKQASMFIVDKASLKYSTRTMRTRGLVVVPVNSGKVTTVKQGWGDAIANVVTRAKMP